MELITLTVDTSVWIDWLDRRLYFEQFSKILDWHAKEYLQLWYTSRIFQDSLDMDRNQFRDLQKAFVDYCIHFSPCPVRYDYSVWGGPDILRGSLTNYRSCEEIIEFIKLVPEPTTLHNSQLGNKLWHKLGDYDILMNHYEYKRDVFLTLDCRDIFHRSKRDLYKDRLGLVILNPAEFVESRPSSWE